MTSGKVINECSRRVKNNLSLAFRSQLEFTAQVLTRVFRDVWDYNEEEQEKQTKNALCFLETDLRKEKIRGT